MLIAGTLTTFFILNFLKFLPGNEYLQKMKDSPQAQIWIHQKPDSETVDPNTNLKYDKPSFVVDQGFVSFVVEAEF
ncbi:hypothetical protein L1887_16106 [Cichorium endivia]|nr:hypothetical protein L1887_16106 [Cichorium endivia]